MRGSGDRAATSRLQRNAATQRTVPLFGRPVDRRCRAAPGPPTGSRKPDPPLSSGRSSEIAWPGFVRSPRSRADLSRSALTDSGD
jgi:hypothetical protein